MGALLAALPETDSPLDDARAMLEAFRQFALDQPALVEVMFARPFSDFSPGPEDVAAALAGHDAVLRRVERCRAAGLIAGDGTDVALALMSLAQGLAAAERAGRLGSTEASIARRWRLATEALLAGLHPNAPS